MAQVNLQALEQVPGILGYLVLNDDGVPIASHGELANDEARAEVFGKIQALLALTHVDFTATPSNGAMQQQQQQQQQHKPINSFTISYDDFYYTCLKSFKRIYILKRKMPEPQPVVAMHEAGIAQNNEAFDTTSEAEKPIDVVQ